MESTFASGSSPRPEYGLGAIRTLARIVPYLVVRDRYRALQNESLPLPDTGPLCLETGAGLCGAQAQVFVDLVRGLGYRARQWGIVFSSPLPSGDETHVLAEVDCDGRWHTFDLSFGGYVAKRPFEIDGSEVGFGYMAREHISHVLVLENQEA